MEVMVGSSFGLGMVTYVRDRSGLSSHDKAVPEAMFLVDESRNVGSKIGLRMNIKSMEKSSDSSSSIGESSENDEEEDEVVSCQGGALDSFSTSLEDSLPMKRGLSNHYVGKSKSFGNLTEASNNLRNLEKVENPFNKRRRLVIANKLRRRVRSLPATNFYPWQNNNSMPLLPIQDSNEEEHEDEDDGDDNLLEKKNIMMEINKDLMAQTQSCFCLSSLQEDADEK